MTAWYSLIRASRSCGEWPETALFAGLTDKDEQGDNLQCRAASRHQARFSRIAVKDYERSRKMHGAATWRPLVFLRVRLVEACFEDLDRS